MDMKQTMERLTPETERLPYWDGVLKDSRPSRARWAAPRLAIVGVVVALAAVVAIAPWQESERAGVLDKALAAVGNGDVLHVVFRGEWGGTVVDLDTGRRTPAYGEREVWYDPKRDLVHSVSRVGGVVERDEVYKRKLADEELTALWQQYREALERGSARLAGQDVIDGVAVHWIIVRSQMLPDAADGKDHEFAQQVAISRESFRPVAMRYTRDGKAPEGVTERILRYETVPLVESDFKRPKQPSQNGMAIREGNVTATLAQAADILGREPYWLGSTYDGLPLAQVSKREVATGRRPNGSGGVAWRTDHTGLVLFYGPVGDDPGTYGKQVVPRWDGHFVSITQTTDAGLMMRGSPAKFVPPSGSIVIMAKRFGYLVIDGVHISITSDSEASVLAAAKALRPISA